MSNAPAQNNPRHGRQPVAEGLPEDAPPEERRSARMRLVAARRLAGLTLVLDGVHDPHNISAVLRSAEGFGLQHAHIIGSAADLSPNRAITKGCHKWLTLHYHPEAAACGAALRAKGFELWAAVPERGAVGLEEIDFSRKIAFVFGGERDGVSDELLSACDGKYMIRMAGFSQSLNVSVAAAISIYTGAARRRVLLGHDTDLPTVEVDALAHRWIAADQARRFRKCAPPVEPDQ